MMFPCVGFACAELVSTCLVVVFYLRGGVVVW